MGNISSKTSSIAEDSKSVNDLLEAAKNGNWELVWCIVGTPEQPRKPYFINCIPEDRRWGLLHQAVYYFDCDVVKTLLKFRTCDSQIKTKEGSCEAGPCSGKTPQELATDFGYKEMVDTLKENNIGHRAHALPTYHTLGVAVEDEELGLLRITLAAYRQAFCPFDNDRSKPLHRLLFDIFRYINTGDNWKTVKDKIFQPLYSVCEPASSKISKCTTKDAFYDIVVNVYTNENTHLYTYVNTALRRQRKTDYRPTADDIALGPYILMFHLLLLYWDNLKKESGTTYRRMNLSRTELNKYKEGVRFLWLAFVSSSMDFVYASVFPTVEPSMDQDQEVVFEIENSVNSQWQPRDIGACAEYEENERIFPAGAEFLVQKVAPEGALTRVYLKLCQKG